MTKAEEALLAESEMYDIPPVIRKTLVKMYQEDELAVVHDMDNGTTLVGLKETVQCGDKIFVICKNMTSVEYISYDLRHMRISETRISSILIRAVILSSLED